MSLNKRTIHAPWAVSVVFMPAIVFGWAVFGLFMLTVSLIGVIVCCLTGKLNFSLTK